MSDFDFPTTRFLEADATSDEVAQLAGEFERSDLTIQRSLTDDWRAASASDLRLEIEYLRTTGHFDREAAKTPREPADAAGGADAQTSAPSPVGEPLQGSPAPNDTPEPDGVTEPDSPE